MKLAASEIAWQENEAEEAFAILQKAGFCGLEIAPPRIAGPLPYAAPKKAAAFARRVKQQFGLAVCSMQSIWFGQQGSLFGPERAQLLQYTKDAILFAEAAACKNLVFGCPKNRNMPKVATENDAISFFKEIGDFAAQHGTVVSLEPNPPIYGTNFINTTKQALAMAGKVASPGFMVNVDFGTIVENKESVESFSGAVPMLHHVHISEPNLVLVQKRPQHKELAALLRQEGYAGYVSIEMKAQPLAELASTCAYVAEVFG